MQRLDGPKIQMPAGSRDVMHGPAEPAAASQDRQPKASARGHRRRRHRSKKPLISARLAVWLGAWLFSGLWIGGIASYAAYFYGPVLLNQPPATLAGMVLAMVIPVVLTQLVALIITRSMRLNDQAMRLAQLARELIDPGTTAANDVAKLGAIIRKELEGLNREIDGAVTRIGTLEGRLQQQTSLIDETSERLDKRSTEITARLADEREKVDAATRSLSDEARWINETLDAQSSAINKAAGEATETLKAAEAALTAQIDAITGAVGTSSDAARDKLAEGEAALKAQTEAVGNAILDATEDARARIARSAEEVDARTEALGSTVSEAAEMARSIAEDIERETGKLEAVSTHARSRAEAITSRYNEQHRAITSLVDKLAEQQARLDAGLDQQRKLLTQMADGATGQIKRIEDAIEESAANFQKAVNAARDTANQAGDGFDTRAEQLASAAEESATKLNDAAAAVKQLSAQAREEIQRQIRASQDVFEQQAAKSRELLSAQAKDAVAAFEGALSDLRTRLHALGDSDTRAMTERASELEAALRKGEAQMRALSDRLDLSIRGVNDGADDVGRRLAETADAFEARMAQFPAHADDAVKKVQHQISTQIGSLAKLADQAAERTQALTRAVEAQKHAPAPQQPAQVSLPQSAETRAHQPAPKPELPGRDVYPQVWDGMEDSWRKGSGRSNGRPRLGQFDDVAKSLVGRLRSSSAKTDRPVAESLRATLKTQEAHKEVQEDISDFRVIRRAPEAPAKPEAKRDAAEQKRAEPKLETKVSPTLGAPEKPVYRERGWKEILQNVDKQAEERRAASPSGSGDEASFQRNALLIIEKLQAMSIDIDRALEDAPPTELLDRYMNGERNVFARRLSTFTGPEMLERIARKFREDAEFRSDVNRYIEAFEDLLKAARGRDRENILIETYLTSQTGKVYMILGSATGHLK